MATKQQTLDRLAVLFPGRLTLTPEEVAQCLYGTHQGNVVEGVRDKIRTGKLPGKKLGRARSDPWLIPVDDLAGVLADPLPTTNPVGPPARPAKPHRGRPLVNPQVFAWLAFWAQAFACAGWAEAQASLERDSDDRRAWQYRQKTLRQRRRLERDLPRG